MCLRTYQHTQQTAEQDKTCYKIVVKREDGYFTPFLDEPIPLEVIKGKKTFKAKGKTLKLKNGCGYAIEGGNIHTYIYCSTAIYAVQSFVNTYGGTLLIFECVIPKGTKYYYGTGYAKTHEYASKQIRFVKQIYKQQQSTQLNLFG